MMTFYAVTRDWVRSHSRTLSVLFAASVLALLVWHLQREWHSLPEGFLAQIDFGRLAGSLAAMAGALLLVSSRWGLTLYALKEPIPWWTGTRIWFLSQAGRYLPGGIWPYVSRFYLCRDRIGTGTVVMSMLLETILRVLSEVLVFLIFLPLWPGKQLLSGSLMLLTAGGLIVGGGLLHPSLLRRIGRLSWLHRVGITMADDAPLPDYGTLLGLLAYYVFSVLVVGVAFSLLVRAIYPLPWRDVPALTGSLAIAVVLGFLVPLAPGGWGVREGVLAVLLGQIMPSAVAVIVAVACRFLLSVAEGFWILLALVTRGKTVIASGQRQAMGSGIAEMHAATDADASMSGNGPNATDGNA